MPGNGFSITVPVSVDRTGEFQTDFLAGMGNVCVGYGASGTLTETLGGGSVITLQGIGTYFVDDLPSSIRNSIVATTNIFANNAQWELTDTVVCTALGFSAPRNSPISIPDNTSFASLFAGVRFVSVTTPIDVYAGVTTLSFGISGTFAVTVTIDSFSPIIGPTDGGQSVTITGSGFLLTGITEVLFGGVPATSVVVTNEHTLTCVTPAHAAGPVSVTVRNHFDGFTNLGSATAVSYEYFGIAAVSPTTGNTDGGEPVQISGSGFASGTTITFGGHDATEVLVVNSARITCKTPAHAIGAVNVVATLSGVGSSTLVHGFTYIDFLVQPPTGGARGGELVTLVGDHFPPDVGVVRFDGYAATEVFWVDAQHINCRTPKHPAGVVDVVIEDVGEALAAFTYVRRLVADNGTPLGGDSVLLEGVEFAPSMTVAFGTVPAGGPNFATHLAAYDEITTSLTTPEHIVGTVDVVINVPGTTPATPTVTLTDAFTYHPVISPISGNPAGGNSFIIVWSDFGPGMHVEFGGVPATEIILLSNNPFTGAPDIIGGQFLQGLTPKHRSETVDVSITYPDGSIRTLANAYSFRMEIKPTIGPASGGGTFTIISAGFLPGSTVTFDGIAATDITIVDDTHLTGKIPAHSPGIIDVVLTIPKTPKASVETLVGGYKYTQAVGSPLLRMGPNLIAKGPIPSTVQTLVTLTPGANAGALTFLWEFVVGPAAPTINSLHTLNTTITFTEMVPGAYIFRLTATSAGDFPLTSVGTLSVSIEPPRAPKITIDPKTLQV